MLPEWPDWSGETAVVIATGPSAKAAPIEAIKGCAHIIAVKSSWQLAPWADALYGCDKDWWITVHGAPRFRGLKISPSPTVCKVYRDVHLIRLLTRAEILIREIGTVGCGLRTGGGHSGFHAINLAVQFGAARIVLVGFDMRFDHGAHWHPHIAGTARHVTDKAMDQCRAALDGCAAQFAELGIEVINASPISALQNYRKAELLEAVGHP